MIGNPRVHEEDDGPTGDPAVDEAFDGFGDTWQFWQDVFSRDSIDDENMPLRGDEFDGDGIRSLKAPGTSFDDACLGNDPSPARRPRRRSASSPASRTAPRASGTGVPAEVRALLRVMRERR